jgi:hypothetical protein
VNDKIEDQSEEIIEITKPAFRALDLVRELPQNAGFHLLILLIKEFNPR